MFRGIVGEAFQMETDLVQLLLHRQQLAERGAGFMEQRLTGRDNAVLRQIGRLGPPGKLDLARGRFGQTGDNFHQR